MKTLVRPSALLLFMTALAASGCAVHTHAKNQADASDPRSDRSGDEAARQAIQASKDLREEWEKAKSHYKDEYEKKVKALDDALAERRGALDYGDKKRRLEIAEEAADLDREKARIKNDMAQLSAATAVGWTQVKGNLDRKIEDVKENLSDDLHGGKP